MATLQELVKKLETYGFECEAGPLNLCTDWHELTTRLAQVEQSLESQRTATYQAVAREHKALKQLAQMEEALRCCKEWIPLEQIGCLNIINAALIQEANNDKS